MQIIITAGNHDSSSKLSEINRNLWKYAGVTVVGSIRRDEAGQVDLERHIVEVKNGCGELKGYVIALPHVYPQNFPALDEEVPREERQYHFIQTLLNRVKERNQRNLPVVLMAHLALTGSDITGQDDGRGGMEYTDIRLMGEGYDYLALGHIHFPQTLSGGRARYCGSPLPVRLRRELRAFRQSGRTGCTRCYARSAYLAGAECVALEGTAFAGRAAGRGIGGVAGHPR